MEETPELLIPCNETNEKKLKEEKVSQDEENNKEEYKDALNCTGFEIDEWNKYNTIVNVVMFTLLMLSFLLIVAMAIYVACVVYLTVQKKIFNSNTLDKEL